MATVKIDIVDMLDFLGVSMIEKDGKEVWFQCPFPGHKPGSGNRNASFRNSESHPWWTFNCFVCGNRGTAINFWSMHQGTTVLMAELALKERYGSVFVDPGNDFASEIERILNPKKEMDKREIVPIDERHLDEREVDWNLVWAAGNNAETLPGWASYMFERGFTMESLIDAEIGYDTVRPMLTVPYRDRQGRLIGFKGRAWKIMAKPKYIVLGNKPEKEDRYAFDTFDVSQTLYGIHDLPEGDRVILCEGELNRMAMKQYGHRRVLGLSGQYVTEAQASILASVATEVVLLFDEDEKAMRVAQYLNPIVPTLVVPERDQDPAEASDEDVAEWLDGAVPWYNYL